jgi:RsiW-degrading membrane proteinase PrsW (M82 family)
MDPVLLLLAIVPGLLISWYMYRMDRLEREHRLHLMACFIGGMLLTLPAEGVDQWLRGLGLSYPAALTMYIPAIAVNEELLKFLLLTIYPLSRPHIFDEPIDGIVYSIMIGMGFATMENIFYATEFGLGTTIVRAFTAVPAHALFAVIMGYYAGLTWLHPERKYRLLLYGLLLAVIFHGVYDFLVLQAYYDWLVILAVSGLWVSMYFAHDLIVRHQQNSPFK